MIRLYTRKRDRRLRHDDACHADNVAGSKDRSRQYWLMPSAVEAWEKDAGDLGVLLVKAKCAL